MTSVQSRRLSVEREIDGRGMEEGEKWVKKGEAGEGRKSSQIFKENRNAINFYCYTVKIYF